MGEVGPQGLCHGMKEKVPDKDGLWDARVSTHHLYPPFTHLAVTKTERRMDSRAFGNIRRQLSLWSRVTGGWGLRAQWWVSTLAVGTKR